jgi:hypothetical protein
VIRRHHGASSHASIPSILDRWRRGLGYANKDGLRWRGSGYHQTNDLRLSPPGRHRFTSPFPSSPRLPPSKSVSFYLLPDSWFYVLCDIQSSLMDSLKPNPLSESEDQPRPKQDRKPATSSSYPDAHPHIANSDTSMSNLPPSNHCHSHSNLLATYSLLRKHPSKQPS